MAHAVLLPNVLAALNIDSLNRNGVSALDLDNGNIVNLSGRSATAGEEEVFTAVAPATGSLTNLWMVYQPDEVVLTADKYAGLDPDPRNFYVKAGKVFSMFKPQIGDIITITADGLAGTKGANGFVIATNASGIKPEWAAAAIAGFSAKLLATTYISIASGSLGDTQRVTAYQFEIVAI